MNFSLPAWLAAGLGLTLYMGAFCTEIFRAGVMSIGRGQWQAGRALGMTYAQLMRRIVLPQAVRRMIPPLYANQIVAGVDLRCDRSRCDAGGGARRRQSVLKPDNLYQERRASEDLDIGFKRQGEPSLLAE